MKKHIKTVAGILALTFVFSGGVAIGRENISVTAPITASAETYGAFTYAIEYGEITIKGFDKSVRDVVIPSEIEGLPVSSIDRAFSGCNGITSVTIPDSVTTIGDYAFYNCIGLTSVAIPDSVTTIGDCAFSGCTGLTSVTISNGVTSISDHAFYGCRNITSVTIPESITYIDAFAFCLCSKLKSVTILNPACEIYNVSSTLGDKSVTTIYGYENSTAQAYAEKYGYTFSVISNTPTTTTTQTTTTTMTTTAATTTTTANNDRLLGDVNGDGLIDSVDATLIMSYYAYVSAYEGNGEPDTFSEYLDKYLNK